MKRNREAEAADSINVANVLMLLARGGGEGIIGIIGISADRSTSPDRVFECKTCSRRFPSFQALGGHRASHKKPRLGAEDRHAELPKPRAHECSVCGLEFAIGQALGGHMRRHRTADSAAGFAHAGVEKQEEKLWTLDLNIPPADREMHLRPNKIFGFELVESAPVVVDCFH